MKHILIVTNYIGFVGFLWNDIHILQEMGYAVSFAANANFIPGENHEEELEKAGVSFYQVDFRCDQPVSGDNIRAYKQLRLILAGEKYDMVHCHTPIAGFIARIATRCCRKRGTKIVYTPHGFPFNRLSSKKKWAAYYHLEKFASRFTDVIININEEDCQNVKKFYCHDIRKINGVGVNTALYHEVEVDREAYRKKLGVPANKIMVLSVGRLAPLKNHQIIIKALGRVPNKEDFVYVICGREADGSGMANELRELAQNNGVTLILPGNRDDIPEITKISDIGALPSLKEGLPLSGVQSLAAGVPLVGTKVQGIRDFIIDGVDGYLCEPYDDEAFAQAIERLADPEVRERMRENCYTIARKFDTEVSHRQMYDIYHSILDVEGENE